MSQTDQKIDQLSQVLTWFITEQQKFNTEQKSFNQEQRDFNEHIEKKIDKTQYYLEEFITNNAKIFFEEQTKQASRLRMLDDEVANLKSNIHEMSLQIRALEKV